MTKSFAVLKLCSYAVMQGPGFGVLRVSGLWQLEKVFPFLPYLSMVQYASKTYSKYFGPSIRP